MEYHRVSRLTFEWKGTWKGEGDHASRLFPYASLHATRVSVCVCTYIYKCIKPPGAYGCA